MVPVTTEFFESISIFRGKYPELAYAQLKIFIDTQDESGAYPDFVNDKFISYNCIKPPIFAYVYEQLMEKNDYFKDTHRLK